MWACVYSAARMVITVELFVCSMVLRQPKSPRTDTLFPCPTFLRSDRPRPRRFQRFAVVHRSPQVVGHEQPADQEEDAAERANQIRSEEHTSELQSLMRRSYAVFCLNNKKTRLETDTQPPAKPRTRHEHSHTKPPTRHTSTETA